MTGGERFREKPADRIGRCPSCDRVSYRSRKAARRAARATLPGHRNLSAYPCPAQPDLWHFGHRPSGGRDLLRWRRARAS
jgi:hypothetical protein